MNKIIKFPGNFNLPQPRETYIEEKNLDFDNEALIFLKRELMAFDKHIGRAYDPAILQRWQSFAEQQEYERAELIRIVNHLLEDEEQVKNSPYYYLAIYKMLLDRKYIYDDELMPGDDYDGPSLA